MAVLLLEPFYGGSHRQLMDLLSVELGPQGCRLVTLPANKWHWRARTAALWLAERIEPSNGYRVLMASGTLNLAELLGLRPDLSPLRKLLYMHENQLAYPVQKEQQRDFQYGYNQVASCLVADVVLFNSCFNRDSFLSAVEPFLNRVPGAGHLGPLRYRLEAKAQVLPFPVDVPLAPALCRDPAAPLHIVWPHRWEHDKGPEEFVQALLELHRLGLRFQVSFLGQQFDQLPPSLVGVRDELGDHIQQWGSLPDRDQYLALLCKADVVVSTATHEFYGVAMLEASLLGCYPLCPNRLVYPEIYPPCCLYNTWRQLVKRLHSFCLQPEAARTMAPKLDRSRFTWESLRPCYRELLLPPPDEPSG
ncbi:glycosyltransferase-like domain-containing protein 1 isoform X3 [Dermacentor silvarum]|uniref:glycosyltransferase-like domain-containing protein 1 isoform X3 n=1 Tax=Dermacentor silvarum TaxID=543639 RepID=UPI001897A807|nr:glycosyltransferase-like domain-containing protein 1 isoform X3 [Dermacentor silvarum]